MKQFFTLSLLVAGTGVATAQITITPAQYPATAATIERHQLADVSGVQTPQTGANRTWDYRNLVAQGSIITNSYAAVGGTSPFPGTIRTRAFTNSLGPFSINATEYQGFNADGFGHLGTVVPAQTFPLSATTGGPNDVLVVPAQNVPVNTLTIPLPLTSTTRVARTNRVINNSTITVQAYGLNQAPLRYVQRVTTIDSVAGWGTLRIPVAGSPAGSAPIPVLLMRRRFIQQDSFYLNNQPAPALLLAALGQTQGSITRSYLQRFFRQNSAQPVLSFQYGTSAFATPTTIAYSAEASIPLKTIAARELAQGGLVAWPNPAARGQALTFGLAAVPAGQPVRLTLRDATGRVVATTTAANGQPATLPPLPAGLYLAEAEAAHGARASRRVVVQ